MRLALALVLLLACHAFAFNEPDGFRGVKWGASREELRAHLQRAGDQVVCPGSTAGCRSQLTIGPVPVTATYLFAPGEDKFETVYLSFVPAQYAALLAIFKERYGAPLDIREHELQNRMGAKYLNETANWAGSHTAITLSRYGSKLDQGRALIGLKSAMDRENEKAKGAIKKGKDDL